VGRMKEEVVQMELFLCCFFLSFFESSTPPFRLAAGLSTESLVLPSPLGLPLSTEDSLSLFRLKGFKMGIDPDEP